MQWSVYSSWPHEMRRRARWGYFLVNEIDPGKDAPSLDDTSGMLYYRHSEDEIQELLVEKGGVRRRRSADQHCWELRLGQRES